MSTADKSSQTLIFCNIPQIHKLALHIFSIIVASLILSSLVEVRRPRLLQHTMQLILKTISCQIAKHNWSHRDSGIQLEAFYSLETFFQVSILIFIYLFLFLWWQGSNPGRHTCQASVLPHTFPLPAVNCILKIDSIGNNVITLPFSLQGFIIWAFIFWSVTYLKLSFCIV